MESSELPRGGAGWIISVAAALVWFAIVAINYVSNDFRSSICGAGFLELPQLCCIAPAWLATNLGTFATVMKTAAWRRKAVAYEIAAILATALAFLLQFSRQVPACSAYM